MRLDLLHPAGRLVLSRRTSSPHPDRRMPRFSPALARTFRPGFSRVPFADRVMFPIFRFSTRITSNRRARSVLAFSAQSLRRSVSRARSRAIACLTRPRRFEPRFARASLRCSRRSLPPLPRGQGGAVQQLAGGQGRGDRHAPVDAHRPGRYRVRGPARGSRRRRHATGPRGPASPGRISRPAAPRGTSGTVPTRPWAPRPGRPSGTPGARPTAGRAPRSGTPRPARPCATTAARPGCPGRRTPPSPGRSRAAPAAGPSGSPAASHGCPARAAVSCRHCSR